MSQRILWMGMAVALTAVSGFIKIPFAPVPFTLQTSAVYLCGAVLGSRLAALSQVGFLIVGLAGLPVFAHGGGPAYVLQPTFGYLAAFPVAAWLIGVRIKAVHPFPDFKSLFGMFSLGMGVIHVCGVVVLYLNLKYVAHHPVSWAAAIVSGSLLFIPGELVKMFLAAVLAKRLLPYIKEL